MFALLARIAITRPGRVLAVTGLLVLLLLPWAAGVFDRLATGGFYAPGDSATRAEAMLDAEFPGAPPNVAIMITAPGDIDGPTARRLGENLTKELHREPGVSGVTSYWSTESQRGLLRSQDGRSALVLLRLTGTEDAIARHVAALHDRYAHDGPGVTVRLGGAPAVMLDVTEQSRADLKRAELITAPLVLGVLLYAFGGTAAALLPIVVGGSAVIASLASLRLLSEVTHISVFSLNLTTALGFALAVDYCLFILRRFREERENGLDRPAALHTSLRTAGRTVLFSGLTVALSLTGALLFPLPYLQSYAYAGIAVVVTSELAALLVLPAAIMLLGERVERGRRRRAGAPAPAGTGVGGDREPGAVWGAIARRVMAHPLLFGGAAVALMVVMALPLGNLRVALADDTVLPTSADSHIVNDAMREDFTVCLPCQIPVVAAGVDAREPQVAARLGGYAARLSRVPGVARVDTVAGSFTDGRLIAPPPPDGGAFVGVHGGAWLSLWPTEPDPLSAGTQRTVDLVRAIPAPYPVEIGGLAPHLVETRDTVMRGLPGAITVVIIATFVLLFLFTGSILLPVKALLLNALNLAAVMGTMVLVFQEGHLQPLVGHFQVSGTVELTSPVLMFCVAFGLSMDYEIFLLARIREEHQRGAGNRRAVTRGLAATGPLLTCAALALIVVMIGVATSQISIIKMIGVGLALAVLLDVTVVRAVLVPAFMALAGRYNWWAPRPLRLLHERFGLREGGDAFGEALTAAALTPAAPPAATAPATGPSATTTRATSRPAGSPPAGAGPGTASTRPTAVARSWAPAAAARPVGGHESEPGPQGTAGGAGAPRRRPGLGISEPAHPAPPKVLFSASTYGRAEDGLYDPDDQADHQSPGGSRGGPAVGHGGADTRADGTLADSARPDGDAERAPAEADPDEPARDTHVPTLGERETTEGCWSADAWFSPHGDAPGEPPHES